jgi:hypothetical protein
MWYFMKNHNDSTEPTVILNKSNSDGFLDFNNSSDMKQVILVLRKLIKER